MALFISGQACRVASPVHSGRVTGSPTVASNYGKRGHICGPVPKSSQPSSGQAASATSQPRAPARAAVVDFFELNTPEDDGKVRVATRRPDPGNSPATDIYEGGSLAPRCLVSICMSASFRTAELTYTETGLPHDGRHRCRRNHRQSSTLLA